MRKHRLVVIGNGMAGARTVEEIILRKGADLFDIVIFGTEPYGNYNRILLSNVLSGRQDPAEIFLNDKRWYMDNRITLHCGETVVEIDRVAKKVVSDKGKIEKYDTLLIATGSRPFIPPTKGMTTENNVLGRNVLAFRTLDDCTKILQAARPGRKVAVIGGGLLGLEAAYGLLKRGCDVHIVHRGSRLMERQLDDQGSKLLKSTIEAMGVSVHLDKTTTEVLRNNDRVIGLEFDDKSRMTCELVLVSAGVRPNSEIGMRAGLTVERGIVVDDHMRSVDDLNVYVVGECAQHRGQVYGLVAPLWDQAKVIADWITGHDLDAAYFGSKLATKLKVMEIQLASMGVVDPSEDRDEIVQFYEPKRSRYKKLVIRDGRLIGAILMGSLDKAAYLMQAFDRHTPLPEERIALLFDIGAPSMEASFDEMSDNVQICNCNGVSKGDISSCFADGCRTSEALMKKTRAGTGCGSCKELIRDLVDFLENDHNEQTNDSSPTLEQSASKYSAIN